MAAALGLLTGMGLGAAAGEVRQKRQQQQKHDDMLFDFYSKNPQLVADNPDAQKFVTKYGGKDTAQAFIGMAQHSKAAIDHFKMAENTTIAPQYNPQGVKLPDTPEAIQSEMAVIRKSMADGSLPKEYHDIGKQHLDELDKQLGRIQTERSQMALKTTETPYQQQEGQG